MKHKRHRLGYPLTEVNVNWLLVLVLLVIVIIVFGFGFVIKWLFWVALALFILWIIYALIGALRKR